MLDHFWVFPVDSHHLVELVGHGTADPAEETSGGQGGLLAKAHGCSCGGHRPSSETKGGKLLEASRTEDHGKVKRNITGAGH